LLERCGFRVVAAGPAVKHVCASMFTRHAELYPHTALARWVRLAAPLLPDVAVPTLMGERYVVARVA
jgi:hypothetical protein